MKQLSQGFKAMLPLIPGIIPFGAVMGSAFNEAKLSFTQAMMMDMSLYSGAAQLATTDLMKTQAAVFVVVTSGLIINARFLLYSAAMSPYLKEASPLVKFFCAFTLTDQSYAAMTANHEKFNTNAETVQFYMGTALAMLIAWHASVIAGFIFGNFAPASWALDFAIPLSFLAMLVPTLKRTGHKVVALFSSILSITFYELPLKMGMIVTALLAIALSWIIIQMRRKDD